MGYSHYIYRPRTLDKRRFQAVVRDVQIVSQALVDDYGLKLAGPMGTGEPVFTFSQIAFNGSENCGHAPNSEIVIPWPASGACGLVQDDEDSVAGSWFVGAQLSTRCCNGDCSYESFILDRVLKPEKWQEPDEESRYFDSCKTAFRPYDWLVTATLLIIKHHFAQDVKVRTDGEDEHWHDAKMLCFGRLGYGAEYVVGDGELFRAYLRIADAIWDANTTERQQREPSQGDPQLGLLDKELPPDHPLRHGGTFIKGTGSKGQAKPHEQPPDPIPKEDTREAKEDVEQAED